jgi:hypothetical protein
MLSIAPRLESACGQPVMAADCVSANAETPALCGRATQSAASIVHIASLMGITALECWVRRRLVS